MKNRSRTTLGILLFIPLAAVLLATFACLPAPVGDPEQSKVDDTLSGAYKGIPTDPADKDKFPLAVLSPWDSHTYLLQYTEIDTGQKPPSPELMTFKAWLTTISGATFLTAQPMMGVPGIPGDPKDKPFWMVVRLDKTADGLKMRNVDEDSPLFKDLDKDHMTREQIEAVIKAHVNDDALYSDKPAEFKKLGKDDAKLVHDVLEASHPSVAIDVPAESQPASAPTLMP